MDTNLSHLPSGKGARDGLANEVFKKYSKISNAPLSLMFQCCWNSACMPRAWKVCLVVLVLKMA